MKWRRTMKGKKRRKKNRIRLGVEYALLMISKYREKKKASSKIYSRKKKNRKAGAENELF